MDKRELITIIDELFKMGVSFDVRRIGEKKVNSIYNQYGVETFVKKQDYYKMQLLLKIREGIDSGLVDPVLANNVIDSIETKGYFQEGTFCSMKNMQYESRLYLNPAISDSYYEFIEEFVIRGLKEGLHFEMKSSNSLDENLRDGIVIYTIESDLEKVTNICLDIFKERPEFCEYFDSPPYGSVRPNPYFGVCQGITNKFGTDTYNSFFNHITCQSFTYLMLEKYPELKQKLSLKIGSEVVDKFMNYELNYSLKGIASDKVSSTFMSDKDLLQQAYKNCLLTAVGGLSMEFYEQLKIFTSIHMYGDANHLMHPAITENTKFLEKYLNDGVDVREKENIDSIFGKNNKEDNGRIKFGFNSSAMSSKSFENNYDFYVPGDLEYDDKGRGGRR